MQDIDPRTVAPLQVSDEVLAHIKAAPWRASKQGAPHEYIMRPKDPWLITTIQQLIREHGYARRFANYLYRYVHIDGYKYWTIVDALNRERLPPPEDPR